MIEQGLDKPLVGGLNPPLSTRFYTVVADRLRHLSYKEEKEGSIPSNGTKLWGFGCVSNRERGVI